MKFLILSIFLFSFNAHSTDWRVLSRKLLGESLTVQIFGELPSEKIIMPAFPKANNGKGIENPEAKKMSAMEKERYDYIFLREIYKVTRMGELSEKDFSKWFNVLSQEGSREGIYHALVLDSVYYNLEQGDYPSQQKLWDFIPDHLRKFTGNSIKKEQLQGLNFFLLKRLVIEKYLNLVDRFTSYDDLSSWYALLSVNLSEGFPNLFQSNLRKESTAQVHKDWALGVSKDLLKSELMIKLHRVFNYLNYSDQKQ